jgi:hypothetical protein
MPSSPWLHKEFLSWTPLGFAEMKPARPEKGVLIGSNGRLVEISLFCDDAYYFIYESGNIFRLTKLDLRDEKPELDATP